MQKGQFSFDFMFALATFLIVSSTLVYFSNDFRESQQKVLARVEAERIAADAASLALYSKAIKPLDTFSYSFATKPMAASSSLGAYSCVINASSGSLSVSVGSGMIESSYISTNAILDNSLATTLNNKRCGESIQISG